MRPQYTIVEGNAQPPISYAEAAAHLRVDSEDDQDYIEGLIAVARDYIDQHTARQSRATTWKVIATEWEDLFEVIHDKSVSIIDPRRGVLPWIGSDYVIPLRRTPLVSVTHVKYYAPGDSAQTTLSSDGYRVITAAEPGLIQIIDAPPAVEDRVDAIEIQFLTGDQTTDLQRHAIKMMVASLYENRLPAAPNSMSMVPHGFDAILNLLKKGGWF